MKKTVYLIYGVSGAGKSWLCNRLQNVTYIEHDKHKSNSIALIKQVRGVVVYEKTVMISTTIKKNPEINFIPILIAGDFITCKAQLISRGGRVTKSLYKRWKRCQAIHKEFGGFSGSSSDALKYLKQIRSPSNPVEGLIYLATTPNGKHYVGQTTNLKNRIANHMHGKTLFAKAVKKYKDEIVWTTIDYFHSQEEANLKENKWIMHYKSTERGLGYNLTFGGEGGKPTEAEKKRRGRLSKAAIDSKPAKWHQDKSNHMKDLWNQQEYRDKATTRIQQARSTEKAKANTATQTKEQWKDEASRNKLINGMKKRFDSEEKREAFSNSQLKALAKPFKAVLYATGQIVGIFENQKTAAQTLNIPACNISAVLNGKRVKTKGYVFTYIKEKRKI